MAVWFKALPLTASCLSQLPGLESQLGHVRKLLWFSVDTPIYVYAHMYIVIFIYMQTYIFENISYYQIKMNLNFTILARK